MKYEETKFRAWGGALNKQMYHFDVFNVGNVYARHGWNIDRQPLMRFTGLHDAKGVEIYEGDVLNYGQYSDNHRACNHEVLWDAEEARFSTRSIRDSGGPYRLDPNGEVIGNIYQNSDLLK